MINFSDLAALKGENKGYKKQKLTGIKELDELEQRISNLEAVFFKSRDIRLKQKDDDISLHAPVFSNSHSSKQTEEEEPKPLDVPMHTKEEEPKLLDVPMGTNTRGQAHYGLDVPMQTEEEDPIPLEIFAYI
ncbi:hypothetical protein Tco_0657554 [Tanacetum coccineum]